ncbi:FAD-dependent oxidoreductase [uncultured Mucilaginibacter sp.]|uniref:FAD-dependent oxidoreductase n=1 Tax=uncultured Mucilaginibacter sp. TaxID=797541 RepID=UPI0025F39D61|nr:FAD-dependent oxidoreductase [uncultured Mucilaginibacter sp.]
MIKKLVVLLLLFWCSSLYAQTIRTDVLVIGGSPSGVAAAIQSARSKVKTILIEQATLSGQDSGYLKSGFVTVSPGGVGTLENGRNLYSGIWDEFRKRFRKYHKDEKNSDTPSNSPLNYDSWSGPEILQKMADTVKNLTMYRNVTFSALKRTNYLWNISIIKEGKIRVISARVVIDATSGSVVALSIGAICQRLDSVLNKADSKLYRTSIAMGDGLPWERYNDITAPADNYPPFTTFCVPMKAVIAKGADNLLVTEALFSPPESSHSLPRQLSIGQGVGAVAAYCAFFKKTTKNLNIRLIQIEIMNYKGYLMPISDITPKDADWRDVQQICATGLIKGVLNFTPNDPDTSPNGEEFIFKPDSIVTTAEIKPVLTEIYSRAFLWFEKEKLGEKFTVGNTLSLISDYTLTDPLVLHARIKIDWKTRYQFKNDFDMNRPITRREFAVLINRYLNPFARTVDLNGNLVN